jgi:hypothetical protein
LLKKRWIPAMKAIRMMEVAVVLSKPVSSLRLEKCLRFVSVEPADLELAVGTEVAMLGTMLLVEVVVLQMSAGRQKVHSCCQQLVVEVLE